MTGIPFYNRRAFVEAETDLKSRGYCVVNPSDNFGQEVTLDHAKYMRMCFHQLLCCDAIYQLEGWENSRGAMSEAIVADSLGLEYIK